MLNAERLFKRETSCSEYVYGDTTFINRRLPGNVFMVSDYGCSGKKKNY